MICYWGQAYMVPTVSCIIQVNKRLKLSARTLMCSHIKVLLIYRKSHSHITIIVCFYSNHFWILQSEVNLATAGTCYTHHCSGPLLNERRIIALLLQGRGYAS